MPTSSQTKIYTWPKNKSRSSFENINKQKIPTDSTSRHLCLNLRVAIGVILLMSSLFVITWFPRSRFFWDSRLGFFGGQD